MMRATIILGALCLTSCGTIDANHRGDIYDRTLTARAEPGLVVASELAFARAAQDRGQWTAFREYSTDDAVMFVPEMVNAHDWLKGRADPPAAVKWQPHEVWSSCDGSLAVTRGAAQWPGGAHGDFTTVWQRQKDGEYKWVMDQGGPVEEALVAPEFVKTTVADCEADARLPLITPVPPGYQTIGGVSLDRTLEWRVTMSLDGKQRTLGVYVLSGRQMVPALQTSAKAGS